MGTTRVNKEKRELDGAEDEKEDYERGAPERGVEARIGHRVENMR